MQPTVIVFSEIFPPTSGGSGRWFYELYSRLSSIKPVFLVGNSANAARFDQQHAHLAIVRYQAKATTWGLSSLTSLREYWRQFRVLAKLIKSTNASAVHCGRILPEGVPALLAYFFYKVPYSCYIHGEDIEVARTSRELTLITKLVMRFADKLICNSQTTKGYVDKYWASYTDKAVILHPGVDTAYFQPAPTPPKPDAEQIPTLLTVGRLQRRKGQDMVIRALAKLKQQGIRYHYRIAGHGAEKPALQALVTELELDDQVSFLSEITDEGLKAEYQYCDLFVLANRRDGNDDEGFGMVLLEAQACGKPVIAGKSGGTWETLQVDKTGWLIDCSNENALVTLLAKQLTAAELSSMGQAGRGYVEANYSWPSVCNKAEQIFGWQQAKLFT